MRLHIYKAAIDKVRHHIKKKNKIINEADGKELIAILNQEIIGLDENFDEIFYTPPVYTPTEQQVMKASINQIIQNFKPMKSTVDIRCYVQSKCLEIERSMVLPNISVADENDAVPNDEVNNEEERIEVENFEDIEVIEVSDTTLVEDPEEIIWTTEEELICSRSLREYRNLQKRLRSSVSDMFNSTVEEILSEWESSYHEKQFCDIDCSNEDLDKCIMTDSESGEEGDALPGAQPELGELLQAAATHTYWRPWL